MSSYLSNGRLAGLWIIEAPLSQSGSAFFAYVFSDVLTKIGFAFGAPPVESAETNEYRDDQDLQDEDRVFRYASEEVRPFMHERQKKHKQQCPRYSNKLPVFAHFEFLHDTITVIFFHHRDILCRKKKRTMSIFRIIH
jgi:hypothetical protein